jgi:hypothetical protein
MTFYIRISFFFLLFLLSTSTHKPTIICQHNIAPCQCQSSKEKQSKNSLDCSEEKFHFESSERFLFIQHTRIFLSFLFDILFIFFSITLPSRFFLLHITLLMCLSIGVDSIFQLNILCVRLCKKISFPSRHIAAMLCVMKKKARKKASKMRFRY